MYLLHLHTAGSGQREPPDLWGNFNFAGKHTWKTDVPSSWNFEVGGLPEARYLDDI